MKNVLRGLFFFYNQGKCLEKLTLNVLWPYQVKLNGKMSFRAHKNTTVYLQVAKLVN